MKLKYIHKHNLYSLVCLSYYILTGLLPGDKLISSEQNLSMHLNESKFRLNKLSENERIFFISIQNIYNQPHPENYFKQQYQRYSNNGKFEY